MDQTAQHKCPWCDVVKNLRGLACHAGKIHKQPASELHKFVFHGGRVPLCACGCGESVKWLQKRYGEYLRGHNGFADVARSKAVEVRKRKAALGELTSWNAGLTKETDARVAMCAIKIAEVVDGKEISRRLAERSEEEKRAQHAKQAASMKRLYANGLEPWNKGRTKETDVFTRQIAHTISTTRLGSDDIGRFSHDEIRSIVRSTNSFDVVEPLVYQNKYSKFNVRCLKCSFVMTKTIMMIRNSPDFCPKCSPRESKGQLDIYAFVKQLFPDTLLSDKTVPGVTEIDVHVPSKRFGVEYNGLYWHSEVAGKGPMYHQNKTDTCAAQGISLLHVYADDWDEHPEIVRSMIRHRLGISSVRTYARACSVRPVDPSIRRTFLERCHIDGDVASKVAFGLYLKDKLIAVLSLRKAFHKKWHTHAEIARFAVELDSTVVGGLSKLVFAASAWAKENDYTALMSYADGRVGVGAGYIAAGFKKHSVTPPTFWWTDYEKRFNRFTYRADKKRGMSEREVANEAGVTRIYGCRNVVLTRDLSSP